MPLLPLELELCCREERHCQCGSMHPLRSHLLQVLLSYHATDCFLLHFCSFYDSSSPIYTEARFLPPSKMLDADVTDNFIGEGCVIQNARIFHSVVGLQSWVAEGAVVEDALLTGADYYEIVNKDDVQEAARETDGYFIKSGIVTIIKDAIIPHGTII